MLNSNVRPSTLEGVKRLAKQIKKKRGLKHTTALELAAQAANCANYRHALRALPANEQSSTAFSYLLTVYWQDRDTRTRGRETLEIILSKPVLELCSKAELKKVRGFGAMRMVAADHFVSDRLAASQSSARNSICQAERSLRFMEWSGLRPSSDYRRAYPDGSPVHKLPSADHSTYWADPTTGQFILVDEPYSGAPDDDERQAWAQEHGWELRKATWPGMYYPYSCDLFVATDGRRGYDVDALMSRINAIPAPLTGETWTGQSEPSFEPFLSPAAKTPQDRRRARSRATILPQASPTTIPYSQMLGGLQRRPAGALTIAGHIEAGRIIKAVSQSPVPYGVYQRMNALRATLEDWLALEIGRGELEGPEFFDVYYHDAPGDEAYVQAATSMEGVTTMLRELKVKLEAAYPDCAPLRKQVHRIDTSVSLLTRARKKAN